VTQGDKGCRMRRASGPCKTGLDAPMPDDWLDRGRFSRAPSLADMSIPNFALDKPFAIPAP